MKPACISAASGRANHGARRHSTFWLAARLALFLVVALAVDAAPARAAEPPARSPATAKGFHELFAASRDGKRSVTLYIDGQTIAGQVVAFDNEIVELRNQRSAHIVVRIDRIDAVAAP